MTVATEFLVFSPEKRKIRPSNWFYRLMEIAATHWQGRNGPQPCRTCAACPDSMCFVFPTHLQNTDPAMVRDLKFCLHMLDIPEISARCPNNTVYSCATHASAA